MRTIALLSKGLTNAQIGAALGLSREGVSNRLRIIYDKLGMDRRLEVALWYVKNSTYLGAPR